MKEYSFFEEELLPQIVLL